MLYVPHLPVVLAHLTDLKSPHIEDILRSSALSRLTEPSCLLSSVNLDKQTAKGSTALHYCCLTDNSECLKLLLRGKASIDIGKKPSTDPVISTSCFSFPSFVRNRNVSSVSVKVSVFLFSFILSHSSAWVVLKAGGGDKRRDLCLALSPVLSVGIELINALLVNSKNKRARPASMWCVCVCVCVVFLGTKCPLFSSWRHAKYHVRTFCWSSSKNFYTLVIQIICFYLLWLS